MYKIDPKRPDLDTGIFIRAKDPEDDRWKSVCISQLTKESLIHFLAGPSKDNSWALDVCGHLLGFGRLNPIPKTEEDK